MEIVNRERFYFKVTIPDYECKSEKNTYERNELAEREMRSQGGV